MDFNICNNCGGDYEYRNGKWICIHCGSYRPEGISNEERTLLFSAFQKLRLAEFNEAELEFDDIIHRYPLNPSGYWGRLLAKYGIKYEEDFDGRKIPTCYATSIDSIISDKDYLKAVGLADEDSRDYYRKQAEYIERVRKEWLEKTKTEVPYDIFISYKDRDQENNIERTEDSINALELYNHLTRQGYNVFYSRESLRNKIGEEYEPYIFHALKTAKIMIVYASSIEYINSTWVKNEWQRYLKQIDIGEKREGSLLVVCDGFSPSELPKVLSSKQCLDGKSKQLYVDIDSYLKKAFLKNTIKEEPKKQIKIDPLHEHVYVDEVVPASCIAKGYTVHRCNCGYEYKDNFTGLAKHTYKYKTTKQPTCTIDGYKEFICSECADSKREIIPATGHVFDKWIEQSHPTCHQKGTAIRQCKICGHTEEKELDVLNHEWGNVEYKETDEGKAVQYVVCKLCGQEKIIKSDWIDNIKRQEAQRRKVRKTFLTIAIISLFVLLIFKVVIPTIRYINAESLLNDGRYDEAMVIFQDLDGYSKSDDRIAVITGIGYIKDCKFEQGVKEILSVGVPVKLIYNTVGGETTSKEIVYNSISDFNGIGIAENTGYTVDQFELVKYSYKVNSTLELELNVVLKEQEYVISYNLDGGNISTPNPVKYNINSNDFTLINPIKKGYTFIGWTGTDLNELTMSVTIPKGSNSDKNYTANWEANSYTVTLDANGGTIDNNSISVEFDSNYTLPTPTKDYYTFVGWYNDSVKYGTSKWDKDSDVTLTAKWTPSSYSLTYNLSGGTNSLQNPKSFTIETPTIKLKDPSKNGYKFVGWYTDQSYNDPITEISAGSHTNITLYAKWEVEIYTITYDLKGGTISGTYKTTFTINDLPLSLPIPSRNDCVFLGWKKDDYNGADISSITKCENTTVYAAYMDVYLQLKLYTPSYSWESTETYYIVTKYSGTETVVDIPAFYEGYPIREITSQAFANNKKITHVNLPDTIKEIGYSAFNGCSSLVSITLPSGILAIDNSTFSNCTSLISVTIPNTVTSIGENAFSNCKALESVTLPNQLSTLESYAFKGCSSLKSIDIPSTLKEIDYGAFAGCNNLEEVYLHEGLEEISFGTFSSPKLLKLVIPKSVTYIHVDAFDYSDFGACSNVIFYCKSATMPSGWQAGWNINRPIIWGYSENTYQPQTYTFVTNGGTSVVEITQVQVDYSPITTKDGYVLFGWYDNADLSGNPIDFPYYSTSKTTLYAKWMAEEEYYDGSSKERAIAIVAGAEYTAEITKSGQQIWYKFVPTETKAYTIYSTNKPYAKCSLYNSAGTRIAYDAETGYNFSVTATLTAEAEDYIVLEHYYGNNVATIIFVVKCSTTTGIGHTVVDIPSVESTCTEFGLTAGKKCITCNTVTTEQQQIAKKVHTLGVKATCTTDQICTTCNNVIVERHHTYGEEWEIVTPATFETDGFKQKHCTACEEIGCQTVIPMQKLTFKLNANGTAYICSGIGTVTDAEFTIPSTYNNLPVTEIGDKAFEGNDNIIKVIVQSGISTIGERAFYNCSNLQSIEVDALSYIGNSAFYGCVSLLEFTCNPYVTISEATAYVNLTTIGNYGFYGCSSLKKVTINNTITTPEDCTSSVWTLSAFGNYAFSNCTSLEEFNASPSLIGERIFENCSSLTSISLKGINVIPKYSFYGCSNLKSISLKRYTWYYESGFYRYSLTVTDPVETAAFITSNYYYDYYTTY